MKTLTTAQVVSHILSNCPTRMDKALPWLEDVCGRFAMQNYKRGYRAAINKEQKQQDVFDNAG